MSDHFLLMVDNPLSCIAFEPQVVQIVVLHSLIHGTVRLQPVRFYQLNVQTHEYYVTFTMLVWLEPRT